MDGKMTLKLSGDKKIVSLEFVKENDQDEDTQQVGLIAWYVKDLSQLKISKELQKCLSITKK